MTRKVTNRLQRRKRSNEVILRRWDESGIYTLLHQPLDFKLERCILAQYVPIHVLQFLQFLQEVEIWLFGWASGTSSMSPQCVLMLRLEDMVLLAVVNDLFPHRVRVLLREIDPVVRQPEVSRQFSIFLFEHFFLRSESGVGPFCILNGVKHIGIEAEFCERVIRV